MGFRRDAGRGREATQHPRQQEGREGGRGHSCRWQRLGRATHRHGLGRRLGIRNANPGAHAQHLGAGDAGPGAADAAAAAAARLAGATSRGRICVPARRWPGLSRRQHWDGGGGWEGWNWSQTRQHFVFPCFHGCQKAISRGIHA